MSDAGTLRFRLGLAGKEEFKKDVENTVKKVDKEVKDATKGFASEFKKGFKEAAASSTDLSTSLSNQLMPVIKNITGFLGAFFSAKMILKFIGDCREAIKFTTEMQGKLGSIMRSSLGATEAEIEAIRELNGELQKTGLVEDDIAAAGAANLAKFVGNVETLKALIPTMHNLAVASGGFDPTESDVTSAATMLGKAVASGNTALLARQGIVFSEAEEAAFKIANEFERTEILTRKIEGTFGDLNAQLLNSVYGKTRQIKNVFGDLQENLGRMIDAVLYPMYDVILDILNALSSATDKIAGMAEEFFGIDVSTRTIGAGIAGVNDELGETLATSEKIEKTAFGFDNLNKLTGSSKAGGASGSAGLTALKTEKELLEDTKNEANMFEKIMEHIFSNQHITNGIDRINDATNNLKRSVKDVVDTMTQIVTRKEIPMFLEDVADITLGVGGAAMQAGAVGMNLGALGIDLAVVPFLESVRDNLDKIYGVWKDFKNNFLDPVIDGVNGFLNNVNIQLDAFIDDKVPRLAAIIKTGFDTIIETLAWVWDNVLGPLFATIGEHISRLFAEDGVLSDCVKKILESLEVIVENSEWFFDALSVLASAFFFVEGAKLAVFVESILGILQFLFIAISGIFEAIGGLFEVVTGLIEGDFEKVTHGFMLFVQGLLDIFINSWLTPIVNAVQDFVNWAIDMLNKIPGVDIGKATFANDFKGFDLMGSVYGTSAKSSDFNIDKGNKYTRFGQTNSRYGTEKFEITNVVQLDGKTVATSTNNINNRNKSTFGNSTFQIMNSGTPASSYYIPKYS